METKRSLDLVMKAEAPWGRVVKSVRDNFAWDFEEATVIDIMKNKEAFFNEIRHFLALHFNIDKPVIDDLIKYQNLAILDPQRIYPLTDDFVYNIHDVIHSGDELSMKPANLNFEGKNYDGNFFDYGKETLWWGRRVAAYKNKIMETGALSAK